MGLKNAILRMSKAHNVKLKVNLSHFPLRFKSYIFEINIRQLFSNLVLPLILNRILFINKFPKLLQIFAIPADRYELSSPTFVYTLKIRLFDRI